MTLRQVKLTDLIIDPRVQARAAMSEEKIEEYREAIFAGSVFPPAIVFDVKDLGLVLADGFHRVEARKVAGRGPLIEVDIRTGTLRDAKLYAVGANWNHGLPRCGGLTHGWKIDE